MPLKQSMIFNGLFGISLLLGACDKAVDGSRAATSVTQKAFADAGGFWGDVFTYHEAKPAPQPQTRYCYKMMTDIVCYDSVQPTTTAQLYGYQDGEQRAWIQPGGGSLGVSGGEPIALSPQSAAATSANVTYAVQTPVESTAVASEVTSTKAAEIQVTPH